MSKQYYVIVKDDCPRCSGNGVVWEVFTNPYTKEPDRRELDCPECGGTGEGERRVSLADALEDLLQPGSELAEFVARLLAEQAKGKVQP